MNATLRAEESKIGQVMLVFGLGLFVGSFAGMYSADVAAALTFIAVTLVLTTMIQKAIILMSAENDGGFE